MYQDEVAFKPAAADPYADLKNAHAAGKTIQMSRDGSDWNDIRDPGWIYEPECYRVKPSVFEPGQALGTAEAVYEAIQAGCTVELAKVGPEEFVEFPANAVEELRRPGFFSGQCVCRVAVPAAAPATDVPVVDKYADLKAAQAAGKIIECRPNGTDPLDAIMAALVCGGELPWLYVGTLEDDDFIDKMEYRVKPDALTDVKRKIKVALPREDDVDVLVYFDLSIVYDKATGKVHDVEVAYFTQ